MAGGDNTDATVARSLVVAKFIAQLCSSVLSSFVGLHHARAMLSPQHRATASVSRSSLLTPSQHQRRTQRISANTTGSNSHTSASDLANSRHLLQSQHMLTPTLLEARAPRRHRYRSRSSAAPKAAASTRILRAACFSDLAFSLTGAVVTGVELFAPAHHDSFQLHFWAQAPHWSAQIASFLWIATLGLYIAKRTNRAAFDVAIAHAVIWLLVVFYWVLELYAMYYKKHALLVTAQVVWNALAVACVVLVAGSWSVFAYRWRRQARRKGAMVLSKILAYALAFFAFVSPIVVLDLVRGLDAAANDTTAFCSVLLALWPCANVAIFLTKQTCLLRFFQKHQHKHAEDNGGGTGADVYSFQSRQNSTRRPGAPGGGPPMLLSPHSHELKGLVIGEKIGEGIAVVYNGKWRGASVAVKMKALLIDSSEDLAEFQHACNLEIQAEAEVMKGLCHPNIVLFMEAGFYHGSICIISEYCARGSLRDVLMRSNVKHLSWPTKLRLALGICHGIQYLHNAHPPMIHRDLKSPNVLVDDSWHAKIADFGTLRFAEIVSSVQNASGVKRDAAMDMTGLVGTTRWMAPEVIRGEKVYTSKVDIYSLALILWELIEGRLPFESTRWNHEIEDFVLQGMRPVIKDDLCPMRWKLLILQCWQPDPSLRPTIQQVITKLQRIAREEVWDTTAPRFTGVSSQFSATQSSLSQASFVSSTVSASFMDSPPSMLGSTASLLRGSSLTSSSLVLGNTKLNPRRTQWSRLSDTLEEQQQQFAADAGDTGDSMSVAESDDEFASSITIIEPSPDDDSFLLGLRHLQQQQQQFPRTTTHLQQQLKWQSVLAASRGGGGARADAREFELSMSDLEIGSSFISTDSAASDELGSSSNVALIESSPTGGYTVTI